MQFLLLTFLSLFLHPFLSFIPNSFPLISCPSGHPSCPPFRNVFLSSLPSVFSVPYSLSFLLPLTHFLLSILSANILILPSVLASDSSTLPSFCLFLPLPLPLFPQSTLQLVKPPFSPRPLFTVVKKDGLSF